MIDVGLLSLGFLGMIIGLLSTGASSGGAGDEGWIFLGKYFGFLLLTAYGFYLGSAIASTRILSHNLEQLAVVVARGQVTDVGKIARRFGKIMKPWWQGERQLITSVSQLLGMKRAKGVFDYDDLVGYQWLIETYGRVDFRDWVSQNEQRLLGIFPNGLKRRRVHRGSSNQPDKTQQPKGT